MSSPPMDRLFVFLHLLSFFLFLGAASDAAMSSQEAYWHTVLPSTPMPSAIAGRLSLGVSPGGGGTTVNVGHGGVKDELDSFGSYSATGSAYKGQSPVTDESDSFGSYSATGSAFKGQSPVTDESDSFGSYSATGSAYKGQSPVKDDLDSFGSYSATGTEIHDDHRAPLFFFESNLRPGAAMTVHFTRPSAYRVAFLPRREADAIPFSSARLPEILDRFSIQPGSPEAETTLSTLQKCERPAAPKEKKLCATSLESMVDFSVANLGTRRVVAASTEVSKAGTPRQTYMIERVRKAVAAEGTLVACHAEKYAYAVFYCHTSVARAYTVSLVGADGAKVEAVAVCHTDTATWNPNHVAFKVLKVSPGTVPVCHYQPEDHLVWSRSN